MEPQAEGPNATRRRAVALVLVVAAMLGLWRIRGDGDGRPYELLGTTMGTSFSVRVDSEMTREEQARVRSLVEERLDRVSRLMSTYDTTSELSRFNRLASTDPVSVSEELIAVLEVAREVSERSGGALDVTVGPLVEAWGFGPGGGVNGPIRPLPTDAQLALLRERVGADLLEIDRAGGTVAKANPETSVDVSAIAKGYAVESVAGALTSLGLGQFLVEVGGELKGVGTRRDGRAWRVGIERPDDVAPGVWGTVALTDEAIATSGDYRNYYEDSGVRYAHIIDPRTGRPIAVRGASVSVVHPNAAFADAWATALTVLGPEEGYAVARREGLAALFIRPASGGLESFLTPALGDRFAVGEAER